MDEQPAMVGWTQTLTNGTTKAGTHQNCSPTLKGDGRLPPDNEKPLTNSSG